MRVLLCKLALWASLQHKRGRVFPYTRMNSQHVSQKIILNPSPVLRGGWDHPVNPFSSQNWPIWWAG